jgi:hypothetical protein
MSSKLNPAEEFTYTYLPEGIHQLVLHKPTITALNQCFSHLYTIFSNAPENESILLISDITESGVPPLRPLWTFARILRERYPKHGGIYDAIIYPKGEIATLFMIVVEQLAKLYQARVGFFCEDEQDQVIPWLLDHPNARKS